MLSQEKVSKLMDKYKIPAPKLKIVKNIDQIDDSLGYPVVMKLVSPDVVHKSDVGGVVMNIHNKEEAVKAFEAFSKLCKNKGFKFEGAMIQKQLNGNYVIVGLKKDPQFGPVVMFGSGGIFVEIMKDVVFRVCPVTEEDAMEMIHEIKGYPILAGARGQPADLKKIAKVIKAVSDIGMNEKIEEMDINPLLVNDKEVSAVDVRMA